MPMIEAAAGAAMKLAAQRIADYLKSAEQRHKDDLYALQKYVSVARDCIIALEGEYNEILVRRGKLKQLIRPVRGLRR